MSNSNGEFPYKLYLVMSQLDCGDRDLVQVAEQAILGGVDIIQLREKNTDYEDFLQKAQNLHELTQKHDIPLIINDNLNVAQAISADGIHVGLSDTSPTEIHQLWPQRPKMVGYSIEYWDQMQNPDAQLADYLGISPIFATPTKTDTVTEWGLEGIAKIRQATSKALVAIGGINLTNAQNIVRAGADSIAVVSAICGADDPQKAAFQLKNEILK
ncbi:MAG: thiamine phosphate synthase [Fibrobacter sp.]|nr:thiamine phosphate synthase [Fibrobacter sp.]